MSKSKDLFTAVPLYIINQTEKAIIEAWIGYQPLSKKTRQSFFVSAPIAVGATLTFVGDVNVPGGVLLPDDAHKERHDAWTLYWRDETDSLNGLKSVPLHAMVEADKGNITLYVVGNPVTGEKLVRVNQEGKTSASGNWHTLLAISGEEEPAESEAEEEVAVSS